MNELEQFETWWIDEGRREHSHISAQVALEIWQAARATPADHSEEEICRVLHYPDHWDTAAYPDVYSALSEVMATFKCECTPQPTVDHKEE